MNKRFNIHLRSQYYIIENHIKETKIKTKEQNNRKNVNICIRITNRDRNELNTFERKTYRRILGPVYENEKENWRILNNKGIYARVKKPTII